MFQTELGVDGTDITKHTFHLPTLGPKLETFRQEVHTGRGIVLLRGLDALNMDNSDLTGISMGLTSYISDISSLSFLFVRQQVICLDPHSSPLPRRDNIIGRQDGDGNALGSYLL